MNLGRWIDKSALKAVAFGFIGMALAIALYLAGAWAYDRYQEFRIIRAGHIAVIQPVLEQRAQQARQQQAAKPTPAPQPEGSKK